MKKSVFTSGRRSPGRAKRRTSGARLLALNKSTRIAAAVIAVLIVAAAAIGIAAAVHAVKNRSVVAPAKPVGGGERVVVVTDDTKLGEYGDVLTQVTQKIAQKLAGAGYDVSAEGGEEIKPGGIYIVVSASEDKDNVFSSGISAEYIKGDGDSKRLAREILNKTAESAAVNSRGIFAAREPFFKTDAPEAEGKPSCRLNVGFVTNERELSMLKSVDYQVKLADGVLKGADGFFNPADSTKAAQTAGRLNSSSDSGLKPVGGEPSRDFTSSRGKPSRSGAKNRKKKTMYFTFDDGPDPKYTPKILDILKRNDIKATFFIVGANAERYPEIVRRMAAEGHTVAVHCYEHDYGKIYKSQTAYINDFTKAQAAIERITGELPTIFRFPGGSVNNFNRDVRKGVVRTMLKNGYKYFDWNAMFGDAGENHSADGVLRSAIMSASETRKEIVMLAHDAGADGNTYKALQSIIDHYKDDFNFEPLLYSTAPVRFELS